jgi:hypothetical protein
MKNKIKCITCLKMEETNYKENHINVPKYKGFKFIFSNILQKHIGCNLLDF